VAAASGAASTPPPPPQTRARSSSCSRLGELRSRAGSTDLEDGDDALPLIPDGAGAAAAAAPHRAVESRSTRLQLSSAAPHRAVEPKPDAPRPRRRSDNSRPAAPTAAGKGASSATLRAKGGSSSKQQQHQQKQKQKQKQKQQAKFEHSVLPRRPLLSPPQQLLVAPTVAEELRAVLSSHIYVFMVLGAAAFTASLAGLGAFGPAILLQRVDGMGERFFSGQTAASTAFGATIAIAGTLGTPLGGFLVDRTSGGNECKKLHAALRHTVLATLAGMVLAGTALLVDGRWLFLGLLGSGCLLLFSTTTSVTLCVLAAVPHESRAFAIAFNTLVIHMLGDVPSPIAIGALKDELAPGCRVGDAENPKRWASQVMVVDPGADCFSEMNQRGLLLTMAATLGWLVWCIVFWGAAWGKARCDVRQAASERARRVAAATPTAASGGRALSRACSEGDEGDDSGGAALDGVEVVVALPGEAGSAASASSGKSPPRSQTTTATLVPVGAAPPLLLHTLDQMLDAHGEV
jgi:hypothetical protein